MYARAVARLVHNFSHKVFSLHRATGICTFETTLRITSGCGFSRKTVQATQCDVSARRRRHASEEEKWFVRWSSSSSNMQ
ncbi:hypothetical protein PICMEDRAFT_96208 [Pichia membranifaciens NRRL Y-2026]|uniref:Uncharacterized protein n=1 Tax=Pichia membranifaciens NRRL Y-2026 TaxID=763406 RepID=A0A1E3NSZ0_9ASCO|nr:hypothetical protein PICMEDRAFT_96208 [Pichia membranifaciens NRRL Y-2026]ODQ49164.1 hypothetical protein PICMEDRAFT_96208 [Pichia membranifaciens NRRL Y-2026]